MAPVPDNHKALFDRLLEGKLSPQDTEALIAWLGSEEIEPGAAALIVSHLAQTVNPEQVDPALRARLEARLPAILGKTQEAPVRRLATAWLRYAAAAVIILFGAGIYFWLQHKSPHQVADVPKSSFNTAIKPGKEGAILTLADGRTVVLDSLGNGVIANQNGSTVVLKNGRLTYEGGSAAAGIAYNTMTTPKGRQFQLVLPDGTKAWLNAASSLRYPTVFTGREREVEVSGEVYFEVTKNARMPFRVKINEETGIEVLGTHFNINSYKDEASINTTLLEGSVRILNGKETAILKPGQQAQVAGRQSRIKVVNDANVEKVMAWKNGVFDFEDATLEEVMRQLERWYDIDVEYEKDVPKLEFIGKMGRDLTLSEVLRGLEMSKVHVRIEGRKLIVLP